MRPASIGRITKIRKLNRAGCLNPVRVSLNKRAQGGLGSRRNGEQMERTVRVRYLANSGRCFLEQNVRVSAAKPERADTGNASTVYRLPELSFDDDLHRQFLPRNVRTEFLKVQMLRKFLMNQ